MTLKTHCEGHIAVSKCDVKNFRYVKMSDRVCMWMVRYNSILMQCHLFLPDAICQLGRLQYEIKATLLRGTSFLFQSGGNQMTER